MNLELMLDLVLIMIRPATLHSNLEQIITQFSEKTFSSSIAMQG